MAFNGIGFFTLSPGASVGWGVMLSGGADLGAQYVAADPGTPGTVVSSNESKTRGDDGRFSYNFTATNLESSRAVSISMQGGGFA